MDENNRGVVYTHPQYHILQCAIEYEYSKNNDDESDSVVITDLNDDGEDTDADTVEVVEISIDRTPDYSIRAELEHGEIDENDDVNYTD